jgi:Flp pilus assembly protein TadG
MTDSRCDRLRQPWRKPNVSKRGHRRHCRRGAVTVEFALAAPVLFLLFVGAYEFARVNMVRHTMDVAAYEGARRGILPGATATHVESRTATVLRTTGVAQAQVQAAVSDDLVSVDIDVPLGANSWFARYLSPSGSLKNSYTLRRERP